MSYVGCTDMSTFGVPLNGREMTDITPFYIVLVNNLWFSTLG
jgi:hypothetical protein